MPRLAQVQTHFAHDRVALTPLSSKFNEKQGLVIRKEQKRIGCWSILPSLLVVLIVAGLATILLLWVAVIHRVDVGLSPLQAGAFFANEGATVTKEGALRARLLGLTLTSIITQAVNLSGSFVVWLAAFTTAGTWLRQQQRETHDSRTLPTPHQYGLLVKLSAGVGIMPIVETFKYLLFRNRRAASPPMLRTSVILALFIYATTRLVSLTDIWLHADSFTIIMNITSPMGFEDQGTRGAQLGVVFNETLCPYNSERVCLADDLGWAGYTPDVFTAGLLVAANASTNTVYSNQLDNPWTVVTLAEENDLAVIVPANADPSLIWTAPSFGIHANCTNISPQCIHAPTAEYRYNCSEAGYPEVPTNSTFGSGASEVNPGRVVSRVNQTLVGSRFGAWDLLPGEFPSNPQEVVFQFSWPVSLNDASGLVSPNTFAYVESDGIVYAYASCQMSYYNLTIMHQDGRYSLFGEPERSSGSFMSVMWGPLVSQMVNLILHTNLQARVLADPSDGSVMAAVNQEVSRLSLGVFSGATLNTRTNSILRSTPTLVSRYSLWAVIIYILLVYAYTLLALGMFFWILHLKTNIVQDPDGKTSTTLELTQRQLSDALSLVSAAFPPNHHQGDIANDFKEENSAPRLVVDIQPSTDLTYRVRERKPWTADP